MKLIFTFSLIMICAVSFSQIKFPKDFKLVRGENGAGRNDYFTNGKYSFSTDNLFADHDYKEKDDGTKRFISTAYGFLFKTTKDGFYWGTGYRDGFYWYVVIAPPNGEVYELTSKLKDKGFSKYSAWLLSTIREYKQEHKNYSFPILLHLQE